VEEVAELYLLFSLYYIIALAGKKNSSLQSSDQNGKFEQTFSGGNVK
jgi:hypothetical protein